MPGVFGLNQVQIAAVGGSFFRDLDEQVLVEELLQFGEGIDAVIHVVTRSRKPMLSTTQPSPAPRSFLILPARSRTGGDACSRMVMLRD